MSGPAAVRLYPEKLIGPALRTAYSIPLVAAAASVLIADCFEGRLLQRRGWWYDAKGSCDTEPEPTDQIDKMYTASSAFLEALWDAGVSHCFVNLGSDHPSIIEAMRDGSLSMADGFTRVTNKPQAVIVHVDVGTQALGAAVRNASIGRAPVLIFAGQSPFTLEGEMTGSRTEFIHWGTVLSLARSHPQGPVYLTGAREVMEEIVEPKEIKRDLWEPVELAGLPESHVKEIADVLVDARLRVLDTGGCGMCFPADHPSWLGFRFSVTPAIKTADVILVVDCDVPWINVHNTPNENARIFQIDLDPLKQMMPVFYIGKDEASQLMLASQEFSDRWENLQLSHKQRRAAIEATAVPHKDGSISPHFVAKQLRDQCSQDTWVIEAITSKVAMAEVLQPKLPGSFINCGGGGLGWSGGAQLGIKLATDWQAEKAGLGLGLGNAYWISRRYNIPVLTIVLNNNGWNAPRKSLHLVHPDGLGVHATNEEINISFSPAPENSGIGKTSADGELGAAADLEGVLKEATETVKGGRSAVLDCKTGVIKF
ncbi:thiamine pyrophosphate binding protein [Penicillium sp. IBT 16267x]|nr:thiamine pyrophosphate binding protein [Penicillium sp. IBT 16267x]